MSYTYTIKELQYASAILNNSGARIAMFSDFYKMSYRKVLNDIGLCNIVVPINHPIVQYLEDDLMMEIYLSYPRIVPNSGIYNTVQAFDFVCLYRDKQTLTDNNGNLYYNLLFPSTMEILSRNINAYPSGTNNKNSWVTRRWAEIANDMVKWNVTGDGTVANGRIVDTVVIRGNEDDGAIVGGSTVDYASTFKTILESMKEFAPLSGFDFDVIEDVSNPATLHTHQYTGQLGTDKSAYLLFSLSLDNVETLTHQSDRLREKTVAIVGGQGEGSGRTFAVVNGDNYSATNAYEVFVDASTNDNIELAAIGAAKLSELKAREKITFDILSSNRYMYKRDFVLGDVVSVEINGTITERKITAVEVTFDSTTTPNVSIEIEG